MPVIVCVSAGEAALRPFEPANTKHYWLVIGDRIQNKFESNLVLDVYMNATALTLKVGEFAFHGHKNQLWTFEFVH